MAPLDYSNYLSDKGKMALPDGSEQTPSSQVVELPADFIRSCSPRIVPSGEALQGLFRTFRTSSRQRRYRQSAYR